MAPDEEVPSISVIYPSAFLYENEIHDLFGVIITNIAVDYQGTLYRTALSTPFSIDNVKLPEPPKQKAKRAGKSRIPQSDRLKYPASKNDQQIDKGVTSNGP